MNILYSQCWEDPELLAEALVVTAADDVLSVASAGDNSLALLLGRPRSVTALDFNPEQLHLLELKMAAMQLDYERFVAFVGARASGCRLDTYRDIRADLSPGARRYWDHHTHQIRMGVIHCGRLERYLASFRRFILPLIHRRALVHELLTAQTLTEQARRYQEHWDNRRWRWLFRLFFSQAVMSRFGRRSAWFNQVTMRDVGGTLLERTRQGLTCLPTHDNYFLEYMLTGGFRDLDSAPPYLRRTHFKTLREGVGRVRLVCSDLNTCLERARPGEYSCFNLSDVFEYMSPQETERTWYHLVRVARSHSRLAFRTLFVWRPPPPHPAVRVRELPGSTTVRERDRTFFYDRFLALETI